MVQICQLWRGKEPGLTKLVRSNRLRRSRAFCLAAMPPPPTAALGSILDAASLVACDRLICDRLISDRLIFVLVYVVYLVIYDSG